MSDTSSKSKDAMRQNDLESPRRAISDKEERDSFMNALKKMFSTAFFKGIIGLLLSSLLYLCFEIFIINDGGLDKNKILNTLGRTLIYDIPIIVFSALTLGAIFTHITPISDITNLISKSLRSIVVEKKFIANLSSEDKKDIVKTLLHLSEEETKIPANIQGYIDQHIESSFNIKNLKFKSDLQIAINSSFCKEKGLIYTTLLYSYRMYKINGRLEELSLWTGDDKTTLKHTKIITPDRKEFLFDKEKVLREESIRNDDILKNHYSIPIPSEYEEYEQLTIERLICSYGFDHWDMILFRTGFPSDGIVVNAMCEPGLIIKAPVTFGFPALFSHALVGNCPEDVKDRNEKQSGIGCTNIDAEKQESGEYRSLRIIYPDWIQKTSGFCYIVSKENPTIIGE